MLHTEVWKADTSHLRCVARKKAPEVQRTKP